MTDVDVTAPSVIPAAVAPVSDSQSASGASAAAPAHLHPREFITVNPLFARPGEDTVASRHTLGESQMLPETAYQIVHDETMLDGNARLNLATFVGTWMDEHAKRLYSESFDKNMIDKDEYPQTAKIEGNCWRILADLWHAPDPAGAIGTSTVGSSEACMLGGLAMKRRWQQARRAAGKSTASPNMVMSSAVQVCREKFCKHDALHRDVGEVSRHRIRRDQPALGTQAIREVVKVPIRGVLRLESPRENGDVAAVVPQLERSYRGDTVSQILGDVLTGLLHLGIAVAAQPQKQVELQQHLRGRAGEVQREGRHVSAEITDIKDQVLGQQLPCTPHHPAQPRIDQTVLVAGGVDGVHPRKSEVPLEVRLQERRDHRPGCAVDMDGNIPSGVGLDHIQRRRDRSDRLIHAGVGGTHDRHHADRVLIDIGGQVMAVEGFVLLADRDEPSLDVSATSLVPAADAEQRWDKILAVQSAFAGRQLTLSQEVNASEQATNFRNRAITWLLHESGCVYSDPMQACEVYTRQCSTLITTVDLAVMGATLANHGVNPITGTHVVDAATVPHLLAEMTMAGLYQSSGDWAYTVGLPGKSGVGGGLLAVAPGTLAIAAFSPRLDPTGNSVRAQLAVAQIARQLHLNLYLPHQRSSHSGSKS